MIRPGREWDNPEAMLGVDDALQQILAAFSPLTGVEIPLLDAAGLVLASDIVSSMSVPPFTNSAMDGYAVRSADTGTAPVSLTVMGTITAGSRANAEVTSGSALRIMTGAPLPPGADAVVRFEEVEVRDDQAIISRQIAAGENVRVAGEDVSPGDVAIASGTRLQPAGIGVLAALNRTTVPVHPRPNVGILSTGDELAAYGDDLDPGMIYDSNALMLAAAVRRTGGSPVLLGIARDAEAVLAEKFLSLPALDLLLVSGGVSVGDFDLVKDVLSAQGEMQLWQVRMKPGKPLAFGHVSGVPVLGLPGNPVAALVAYDQFARPAILTMLGRRDITMPRVRARVARPVENRGRRRHFVRGVLIQTDSGPEFHPSPVHGSAMLKAAAESNCYLVVPETRDRLEAGEFATVQLPDEGL